MVSDHGHTEVPDDARHALAMNRDEGDPPAVVTQAGFRLRLFDAYLAQHPHPDWLDFGRRLDALSRGPAGDRVGDLLLIARNSPKDQLDQRYYFSAPYHSWHGSATAQDSELPLVVAHPGRTSAQLKELVSRALGHTPRAHRFGDLMHTLRCGSTAPRSSSNGRR